MKTIFMEMKQLALLRRIARALETANDLVVERDQVVKPKRTTPVKITRKTDAKEDYEPYEPDFSIR